MLANAGKFRDRTPEIKAAGKLKPHCSGAAECLVQTQDERTSTPEVVKQFRRMTQPEPSRPRVSGSSPHCQDLTHGIKTKSSLAAGDLLNPPPKTRFQQAQLNLLDSVYSSTRKAPLGSSYDQFQGLPSNMDLSTTVFGKATLREESAGSIVTPQKNSAEVEAEHRVGRELYKKSHNDWEVGEMVDRDYDWSKFTRDSLYGVPTPHDNSGSQVKSSLHWMPQSAKCAEVVSKRVDDFRERTHPQLGKVHDPIAETLDVPDDHTFGIMVQPDECNAGELMHSEGPSTYQQCKGFDTRMLVSIRHRLKKDNFCNFDGLLDALHNQDKDGCGRITPDQVNDIFFQFNVPLTPDMLELLLTWCMVEGEEGGCEAVMYREMVHMLNWKMEVPDSVIATVSQSHTAKHQGLEALKSPEWPLTTADKLSSPLLTYNYRTSSQMVKATVGGVPTHNYRTYGVPTIRSDLPAPRIRRVGDSKNYGDESGAYGLMYPSIYSNKGVYEEDFFAPRPPEEPRSQATSRFSTAAREISTAQIWEWPGNEVRQVFANIGVSMSPEVFEQLWKEAERRDPKGQVSVESFRALMEEVQAHQLLQDQPAQGELMASSS